MPAVLINSAEITIDGRAFKAGSLCDFTQSVQDFSEKTAKCTAKLKDFSCSIKMSKKQIERMMKWFHPYLVTTHERKQQSFKDKQRSKQRSK